MWNLWRVQEDVLVVVDSRIPLLIVLLKSGLRALPYRPKNDDAKSHENPVVQEYFEYLKTIPEEKAKITSTPASLQNENSNNPLVIL